MKKDPIENGVPKDERRIVILEAALDCFLKFGYAKTSLDDIAKQARLSRPLIYLKYKNKEEIFKAVFDYLVGSGYETAQAVMASKGDRKKKLMGVYEALLLALWDRVMGHPMSKEFYDSCSNLFPEIGETYDRIVLKHVTALLEDKQLAEIFFMAVIGMQADMPTTEVLRQRIQVLVDRLAR